MDAPVCRTCGRRHWASQPHLWPRSSRVETPKAEMPDDVQIPARVHEEDLPGVSFLPTGSFELLVIPPAPIEGPTTPPLTADDPVTGTDLPDAATPSGEQESAGGGVPKRPSNGRKRLPPSDDPELEKRRAYMRDYMRAYMAERRKRAKQEPGSKKEDEA